MNFRKFIRNEWLWLVMLLILASSLRFYKIDQLTNFQYDQARDALYTKRLVADHKLRLIGPQASPGFYTGPAYYYLMAPFLWLFQLDPAGVDFGVAVLSIISVLLLYFLLKRITNNSFLSLILTFLYSIQPQILWQSRFSWNPNLTPFFMLLFLWGFFLVLDKKTWGWLLSAVSLGFLIQLHFSTVCLLPMVPFFLYLQRQDKKLFDRWFFLSLVAFTVMMSPFLMIELRHNFPNVRNLIKFVTKGPDTDLPPPPLIQGIWGKLSFLFVQLPFNLKGTFISLGALVGVFIAACSVLKATKKKSEFFIVVSPVLLLIFMSIIYRGSFFQYYLTFLYPVSFLILGVILSAFLKTKFHYLFLLLFLPVVFTNIKQDLGIFKKNSTVNNLKNVAEALAKDDDIGGNFNIVGIRGGDRYDHNGVDYRYFLETFYNKKALDWDIEDYRQSEVLYIISNLGEVNPFVSNIWEIGLFEPKEIVQKWMLKDNTIIYKLVK